MAARPNPLRLARWTISGACISSCAFYILALPTHHVQPPCPGIWDRLWADRLQWMMFLFVATTGLVLWNHADRKFKRIFADNFWTEAELAPVRSLLDSSAWIWLTVGMLALMILAVCFTKSHIGTFIYVITLPLNAVGNLKRLVNPHVRKQGPMADWHNFKPLRSDHWGEVRHEKQLPS